MMTIHPAKPLKFLALVFCSLMALFSSIPAHADVYLTSDRLMVDGKAAPFLFGAELQYFRARGGSGRNVDPAKVNTLWDKLLDRVNEAGMNAVSLYVPWDFHEPREGVYDFTGSLDQDGDGHPDYPSRNLRGFLEKIQAHGIKYVMIRPGPYINAEWGPTGFGAIPHWFFERYPEAIAKSPSPNKPPVATFAHPQFKAHVERWFSELYRQVLKDFIGPGKPIVFVQIDNETNFFWDSVYERDYSPTALAGYHTFLSKLYGHDIALLNKTYGASFASFQAVPAPTSPDDKVAAGARWHYDWFLWHDEEIRDYYHFLRQTWERIGLHQPDILFTRCDSFNSAEHGLLPRLDYGEDGGLSLSTLNIYPKTYGSQALSTLNHPMKAAHDASLIEMSHAQFYGAAKNWLMSTETIGGWFPPTEVSLATRQHTYATLLGTGVKAMTIYYFHEGYNWDGREQDDSELHFDAPLDKDMNPRPSFALLKSLGASLKSGLGDELVASTVVRAPVLIAHDTNTQYGLPGNINAQQAAAEDSAGLFGLFRAAGTLPVAGFVDRMSPAELQSYKLIVWNHPGYIPPKTLTLLQGYVQAGGHLVVLADTQGQVAIPNLGKGSVTRLATNPAIAWNDDRFLGLSDAQTTLNEAKAWLAAAKVDPIVTVSAGGQEPFVHAWLQRAPNQHLLLYVENFTRQALAVTLRFGERYLPASHNLIARRTLAPYGSQDPGTININVGDLKSAGLPLRINADGVDVWDLSPQP